MSADPPKVVVVDDDPSMTRLVEVALKGLACEVVTSNRAFGLLSLVAIHRPKVVVLDVMMPGLDGPSLVELLRDDPELRETPVILWSAMPTDDLHQRAAACGANKAVAKADGPTVLRTEIQLLADLQSA